MAKECRMSDLTVVRQIGDSDRALGYAEGVTRTTGVLAGGWGENLEYLRGLEAALSETLNCVREAIGAAETKALTCSTCGAIHTDADCFGEEI